MTLVYAGWTMVMYNVSLIRSRQIFKDGKLTRVAASRQAYATAASVRGSNAPAAFDELALSTRFHICTSLFCATMTLLCLGALATSAFPQQDAAKWLSRAIWVGWLCTWGFGVFGLTNFVASDIFLATFCTAAACGTSPETLRLTMIFVRILTRSEDVHVPSPSLTCITCRSCSSPSPSSSISPSSCPPMSTVSLGGLPSKLVNGLTGISIRHTAALHPHIFMSPDSDTEDEYSDPDEGFQRKLEGHLVSIGEPHLSEYLAARALRHGTLEEKPARSESRRRVPYSSRQQESDISEEDETPGARPVAKVSPRPVASRSSLTDSSGSSSTYRQQPRPGSNAGRSYQRGHTADENLSSEGESSADEGPQLYDEPRKSTRS